MLASLAVICGIIGRRYRATFARWSAHTFGLGVGAVLLNLMMALGMSGWGGFQMGLGGTSFGNLFGLPWWGGPLAMAILIVVLGNLNVNRWNVFVWLTTLSALALAVTALVAVGLRPSLEYVTEPFSAERAFWVVGSIISFASLFSLRSTDFTWDLASDRDVIIDGLCFLGVFLISLVIGIQLFRTTGDWDLAQILAGTPLAILGQIFLFVSLLSPALSTMHSGALAWAEILPLKYWQGSLILVGIGLILGLLRFDRELLTFLDWVGAILPPAMVVMIISAWWVKKPPPRLTLFAWLVGAATAMAFKLNGQIIHLAAGAIVSYGVLVLGKKILNER